MDACQMWYLIDQICWFWYSMTSFYHKQDTKEEEENKTKAIQYNANNKGFWSCLFGLVWFVLFNDTWPQWGHSVSCMTILFQNLQITRSDIRSHTKWLSAWWLHMVTSVFLRGLCGYIWVNILTVSPLRVIMLVSQAIWIYWTKYSVIYTVLKALE